MSAYNTSVNMKPGNIIKFGGGGGGGGGIHPDSRPNPQTVCKKSLPAPTHLPQMKLSAERHDDPVI